mgnify:CR=1 FL=1
MKLDKSNLNRVERNISPPMALAITLPVHVVGPVHNGMVIYVAASPFCEKAATAEQLKDVARRLTLHSSKRRDR